MFYNAEYPELYPKERIQDKRDYIKPLINSGKLEMTISNKPTSKNQKYVTIQ